MKLKSYIIINGCREDHERVDVLWYKTRCGVDIYLPKPISVQPRTTGTMTEFGLLLGNGIELPLWIGQAPTDRHGKVYVDVRKDY